MEQAGVQLIAAGGDVYISTMSQATKVTNTFVDATDKGAGKVSAAGQVMIGGLRKVGEFVVDSFAQATKATAVFLKDSVDLAGDFQAGMNEFRVAAGKDIDTKGIEQFHDLFIQLGKDLPVSTSDVQQAAIELVKGGIDPATVAAGGLKQSIQFAAAAMKGDLVGAAEISSKIVAGWADVNATAADKATLLTHATDLFTKAANASSTDVAQLSRGIFNAQGIAKTAGVSLDDLATTIAELSGDFSSSAEAGTSLKNMIARLQPTTDPAREAMYQLGLYTQEAGSAFYDAQGNFVGFQQASELLKQSLQGLTKEQQAQALQTIFGNDAMSAAAGLAARGADGYQVMADSLQNAMGVAEAGATIQSGYNTALENAKGSVEAFQIQMGEKLLPVLTGLLDGVITPGINVLSTFGDAVFGSDEAFNQLSPTLQDIVHVIDVVVADVQEIIGAFDDAGAMSSEFGESVGQLASDLGMPGELIEDIVFGIQDLVAWFGTASDEAGSLAKVVDDLSGVWIHSRAVVADELGGYQAIAQAILPQITRFVDAHGTEISAFLQGAYDKIISIVNVALDLYDAIVPKVLNSVAGWIDEHATGIQAVLSGAWAAISGIIDGALTLIEGTLKIALDVINGDWSKAWTDLQTMSAAVVLDIGQVIGGFLDIIAGLFNTSMADIVQTWEDNWTMLVDIATQTDWAAVGESVVSGILQGLRDNWSSLTSWVSDKIGSLVDSALSAIGAGSPAVQWMPVGEFSVTGIMQGFSDTWPQLTTLVDDLSDDLIKQVGDISSDIQGVIADSFSATASIDRQVAANLEKVGDIENKFRQQFLSYQLRDQQKIAESFADPATGAAYFKKASGYIFELEDLRNKLNAAATAADKERITQQIKLIESAQGAEMAAFNADAAAKGNPYQNLIDQIAELMQKGLPVNDTGMGHDLVLLMQQLTALFNAPHRASGGPIESGQPYWVGEQGPELFWPQMGGMVSPAASSQQMASRANTTQYNGQVGNTFNMPIYTNQSPQALQQSWAILQASLA